MTAKPDRHLVQRPKAMLPHAEINITPMIDILLVLLVIFMAALPLSQRGLDANLPPPATDDSAKPPDGQIVVEYTAAHELSINKTAVRDLAACRCDYRIDAGALALCQALATIPVARSPEPEAL